MMEVMRSAAKSWVAKGLIFMLAASFGIWGIADVFRGFHAGALATVGGIEISADQFNHTFTRTLQTMARQTGQALTPDEARRQGIDKQVLNNLIQGAAIDNQAKQLKLAVSDQQIVRETQANPAFFGASGKFDQGTFARLLEQNGLNEPMFFAQEKQNRLRNAVVDAVEADLAAPKILIEANYRHDNEQRDARYFVVKAAESEVTQPAEVEVSKYYDDNHPAYTAPEYRSIAVMRVESADVAARVSLTDADTKAGYDKYKELYFSPEKRTIIQITFPSLDEAKKAKDRISAGTDIMAMAKERGLAEKDVTFTDKAKADLFDPAIADAAFATLEGTVSDPVKGALATAIIKVVKVTPEHQATLNDVKPQLTERLKMDRAGEEIDSIYGKVEDARAAKTGFEEIAKAEDIPFQLIAAIDAKGQDKDGKPVDFPYAQQLLKGAFAENMDVGTEVDALKLDNGGYVWYEIRSVTPSAVKPLAAVHDKVKADIVAERLKTLALDKATKLAAKGNAGASLDALAKESGQTVQKAEGLKRNETGQFDAAATLAVFSVPEKAFTAVTEPDGKSAKVLQVDKLLLPPFNAASADAKKISDSLKQSASNDLITAYLAAVQKEAGVSTNDSVWRQIAGQAQ